MNKTISHIICASVISFFAMAACTQNHEGFQDIPTADQQADHLRSSAVAVFKEGQADQPIFSLVRNSCDENKQDLSIILNLVTPFNERMVIFDLRKEQNSVRVAVDKSQFKIEESSERIAGFLQDLCKESSPTNVSFANLTLLTEWMRKTAPDCKMELNHNQWTCELPRVEAASTIKKMDDIKNAMIHSWSRQPYILARRAAITKQLASSVYGTETAAKLDRFCRVHQLSLPEELPLVMVSDGWKKSVCGTSNPERIKIAEFGLAKAVEELESMRKLFEMSSKVGLFAVQIPRSALKVEGVDDIVVQITPQDDVFANLKENIRSLLREKNRNQKVITGESCWHPVFSETKDTFELAQTLNLAGRASGVECLKQGEKDSENLALTYFSNSLSSETEFSLRSGGSRMIRLPKGHYTYKVIVIPSESQSSSESQEDERKEIASGNMIWDAKRPSKVVRLGIQGVESVLQ